MSIEQQIRAAMEAAIVRATARTSPPPAFATAQHIARAMDGAIATHYAKSAEGGAATAEPKKKAAEGRWVTLKSKNGKGTARVQIGRGGKILKGPPALAGGRFHKGKLRPYVKQLKRDRHSSSFDQAAADHGVEAEPLRQAAEELHKAYRERHAEREAAKAALRKYSGLNAGSIRRLENKGLDNASPEAKKLAHAARIVAREYPELGWGGEFEGVEGSKAQEAWSFLSEGRVEEPKVTDSDLLREAAQLVRLAGPQPKPSRGGRKKDYQPDDDIPFSRGGQGDQPTRYKRIEDAVDAVLTRYSKGDDEYTRDADGKFASEGGKGSSEPDDDADEPEKGAGEVIGSGSTGEVRRFGDQVRKTAKGLEGEVYKKLRGVEGVAPGRKKGGYIVAPFYKHFTSAGDRMPPAKRKAYTAAIEANLPRIVGAVTALSEEGYDYNDPLQVGFDDEKASHLVDFSAVEKSADATGANLARLGDYLDQFGLEKDGKAVKRVASLLPYLTDESVREFDSDSLEADDAERVLRALGDEQPRYAYYSFNDEELPELAQTQRRDGVRLAFTAEPLSAKEMRRLEVRPAIHREPREQRDQAEDNEPGFADDDADPERFSAKYHHRGDRLHYCDDRGCWTVQRYAKNADEGKWVTIGAKSATLAPAKGDPYEGKVGGTPVFLKNGKIEKGPPSLKNKTIDGLKKETKKKKAEAGGKGGSGGATGATGAKGAQGGGKPDPPPPQPGPKPPAPAPQPAPQPPPPAKEGPRKTLTDRTDSDSGTKTTRQMQSERLHHELSHVPGTPGGAGPDAMRSKVARYDPANMIGKTIKAAVKDVERATPAKIRRLAAAVEGIAEKQENVSKACKTFGNDSPQADAARIANREATTAYLAELTKQGLSAADARFEAKQYREKVNAAIHQALACPTPGTLKTSNVESPRSFNGRNWGPVRENSQQAVNTQNAIKFVTSLCPSTVADVKTANLGQFGRAFCQPPAPVTADQKIRLMKPAAIATATDDPIETHIHELGHHLEHSLFGAREAALDFLRYRTRGDKKVQFNQAIPGWGVEDSEKGWKDEFDKAFSTSDAYYCGKDYDGRATEILSMGIQKIYENPADFHAKDPEYFKFCIGVLRGAIT